MFTCLPTILAAAIANSGGGATDPLWDNVSLLMHGEGINNGVVFTDQRGHVFTAVGDAKTTTADSKFGTSCMIFDGTGDYISTPDSNDLDLPEDFTIELFLNSTDTRAAANFIIGKGSGGTGPYSWAMAMSPGASIGKLYAIFSTVTNPTVLNTEYIELIGTISVNNGVWNHIAWTRQGSVFSQWVNGVLDVTKTWAPALFNNAVPVVIGASRGQNQGVTNNFLAGKLDEIRITKGVSRYNAAFTPPTAAFPDLGTTDSNYANVVLLMHGDGANNGTVFTDQKGHAFTVSGQAKTNTAIKQFGTAAIDFDGAGDYIETVNSTDFDFGTGDYTVEFWLYPRNLSAIQTIIGRRDNVTTGQGWALAVNAGAGLDMNGTGSFVSTANGVVTINTWQHITLERYAGTTYIFKNGVPVISKAAVATTNLVSGQPLRLGGSTGSTPYNLNGLVDDVRVTKGVARYRGLAFTPSDTPFPDYGTTDDPYYANVALLMHMDGTNNSTSFIDSSPTPKTISVLGDAHLVTSGQKFGIACATFDGAGDGLYCDAPELDVSTGDFTIEGYFKVPTESLSRALIVRSINDPTAGSNQLSNLQYAIYVNTASTLICNYYGIGASGGVGGFQKTLVADNIWHHVVLQRIGNTMSCYVDGVLLGSNAFTGSLNNNAAWRTNIGRISTDLNLNMKGVIDEVRITKGVGRYTANFTPLTAPFPNS